MKILLLSVLLLIIALRSAEQPGVVCSPFIRLNGNVLVQACRKGKMRYLAFRMPRDTGAARQAPIDVQFEVSPPDIEALATGMVNHIAISFNAREYHFTLNKGDGAKLKQLCTLVK